MEYQFEMTQKLFKTFLIDILSLLEESIMI